LPGTGVAADNGLRRALAGFRTPGPHAGHRPAGAGRALPDHDQPPGDQPDQLAGDLQPVALRSAQDGLRAGDSG
nr:hypothetical protein [Tanacetum cinerariifolium]